MGDSESPQEMGRRGKGSSVCVHVRVCVSVSVFAEWMGKERGPSCTNTQGGERQGEGVRGRGAYRGGPCRVLGDQSLPPRGVLQALRSYVSPSRAGWPSLWPGWTISAISHSSLAPTGTPSTQGDPGRVTRGAWGRGGSPRLGSFGLVGSTLLGAHQHPGSSPASHGPALSLFLPCFFVYLFVLKRNQCLPCSPLRSIRGIK